MEYVADVKVRQPGPLPEGYTQAVSLRLEGETALRVLNDAHWGKLLEGKIDTVGAGAMVMVSIYPFAARPGD